MFYNMFYNRWIPRLNLTGNKTMDGCLKGYKEDLSL